MGDGAVSNRSEQGKVPDIRSYGRGEGTKNYMKTNQPMREKPLVMLSRVQIHALHQLPNFKNQFTPGGLGTLPVKLFKECPVCKKKL